MASTFYLFRVFTLARPQSEYRGSSPGTIADAVGTPWSNAGIIAGIGQLVFMAVVFIRGFMRRGTPVAWELGMFFAGAALLFLTAILAFTFKDGSGGLTCAGATNVSVITMCNGRLPIAFVSIATGGWLALYCLIGVFVTMSASSSGQSPWSSPFRTNDSTKEKLGDV
ncbi:uncharacterized protein BXZ73DRAFT_80054 [Epithele typhae]|uniref:uncharacterized protein n=1 Tax=Epithele typhae TaxID=378194 RepID=UPI002007606D|nr:uncharacterized protein BXZ73DRAFT_80054 [Epithele typhae]KAH9920856.1 hypothetical protein BXZ73DRAFT_80054 [Epithele typhae]